MSSVAQDCNGTAAAQFWKSESAACMPPDVDVEEYIDLNKEDDVLCDITVEEYLELVEKEELSRGMPVEDYLALVKNEISHDISKEEQISLAINVEEYKDSKKEDEASRDITVEEYLKLVTERKLSLGMPDYLTLAKGEISHEIFKEDQTSCHNDMEDHINLNKEDEMSRDITVEDNLKLVQGEISHEICKEDQTSCHDDMEDHINLNKEDEMSRDITVEDNLKLVKGEISHEISKEDQTCDFDVAEYDDLNDKDEVPRDITVEEYLALVEEDVSREISKEDHVSRDISVEEDIDLNEEDEISRDITVEDYLKITDEEKLSRGMPVEDFLKLAKISRDFSKEDNMPCNLKCEETLEVTHTQRCIKYSTKLVLSAKIEDINHYSNISVKYFQTMAGNEKKKLENADRCPKTINTKSTVDDLRYTMFKDIGAKFAHDISTLEAPNGEVEALRGVKATDIPEVTEKLFDKKIDEIPQKPCESMHVQHVVVGELFLETLHSVESLDERFDNDLTHRNFITEDIQEQILVEEKKLEEKEKVDVPSQDNNDGWPNNVLNLADANNDALPKKKKISTLADISNAPHHFSSQCNSDIFTYTMKGYPTSHHTQMLVFKTGPKRRKPSCTSLVYCPVIGNI
eukprot:Seg1756.18 transcript_id=Seg1756.18/GoldUCD/mRNA.D3Y31 product="hypothetical protein" protein_id=Seg1756.18/GoldUCD/D3Y31